MIKNKVRNIAYDILKNQPTLRSLTLALYNQYKMLRHLVAIKYNGTIKPTYHKISIAVTADCNSRCIGCRYGRDFMPGHKLPFELVKGVLEDASKVGFKIVRLYGGEPLLHKDLPKMISLCKKLNLKPYLTTNAVLLNQNIDRLFDAGLRDITVGFYGVDSEYDKYVQVPGLFKKVERGIATAHKKYGNRINMQLNWLLMRPTCNLKALHNVHEFAERYDMRMHIDLIHYSLPYFQEGPNHMLQFREKDRKAIETIVEGLLRIKHEKPEFITESPETLNSITDWLLKGSNMKVPCTAYEMIWVGADGTVQLCYVTFKLGNLYKKSLQDMLGTNKHLRAAEDAFYLNCPNCHCEANFRIMRHWHSRRRYSCQ